MTETGVAGIASRVLIEKLVVSIDYPPKTKLAAKASAWSWRHPALLRDRIDAVADGPHAGPDRPEAPVQWQGFPAGNRCSGVLARRQAAVKMQQNTPAGNFRIASRMETSYPVIHSCG